MPASVKNSFMFGLPACITERSCVIWLSSALAWFAGSGSESCNSGGCAGYVPAFQYPCVATASM